MRFRTATFKKLTIRYYDITVAPGELISAMEQAHFLPHLGRGGIKIVEFEGRKLVSRKYLHGGLLRFLTRDRFVSSKRCRTETDIISRLHGKSFPVVIPFAAIAEKGFLSYRLNILTNFEEGSVSLLEYLKTAPHRDRMRTISVFVHLFCRLQTLGVFHPDLHMGNVILSPSRNMLFLDFDRAAERKLTRKDREFMLWRLWRHIDKMERSGVLILNDKEKTHFLKTYGRVSGFDPSTTLAKKRQTTLCFHRIGAAIESLLYRRDLR